MIMQVCYSQIETFCHKLTYTQLYFSFHSNKSKYRKKTRRREVFSHYEDNPINLFWMNCDLVWDMGSPLWSWFGKSFGVCSDGRDLGLLPLAQFKLGVSSDGQHLGSLSPTKFKQATSVNMVKTYAFWDGYGITAKKIEQVIDTSVGTMIAYVFWL